MIDRPAMFLVPPRETSDEELMRRVQRDDTQAFATLFDRHGSQALGVASAICGNRQRAEDAVQEGFISIWRSRDQFRPGVGTFGAWSMTIVRNRAIDSVRRNAPNDRHRADEPEEWSAGPASVAQDAIDRSEATALRASLSRLPEAQAEVIGLAYFGELTHSEIAAHLELPSGTVKGRMRLGLEKLRADLEPAA